MAKYIFLLPRKQMAEKVTEVIKATNTPNIEVKTIATEDTLNEAHEAIRNGADIIIARGIQANIIKRNTNYTVIEIAVTGQEMGILVKRVKEIIDKEKPFIAVMGIKNMYCDMTQFNTLYDVNLKTYFVDSREEIPPAVDSAFNDGADIIIGGDIANRRSEELGIPHFFVDTLGEEAIKNALNIAFKVGWAIDLERKHSAQLHALLDYSFNGIIKITKDCIVEILNSIAEDMLNTETSEIIGKHITSLISELDESILKSVLEEGKEHYASYMQINGKAYAVSIAPILVEKHTIDGAIISFSELQSIVEIEKKIQNEVYLKANEALLEFSELENRSAGLANVLTNVKLYAQTREPILIIGPAGSEKELLPQCIHRYSPYKSGPYTEINCSAYTGKNQYKYLFSGLDNHYETNKGIISLLHKGTLVLNNIESLTGESQSYLLHLLSRKAVIQTPSGQYIPVFFRLIATTGTSIEQLVDEGKFDIQLYYILNPLSVIVTPLIERKMDIEKWIEYYLNIYCKKYSRYISLTKDSKKALCDYYWKGNLTQIRGFCERIVITSSKRSLNRSYIENMLMETYPILHRSKGDERIIAFENLEEAEILSLLKKYNGNRTIVAKELGISTTTLWRRIKKLGIEKEYKYRD